MILYPAIDLKDGKCVRLRQGDMAQATIFNSDPAAQARAFESAGFEWLHCVDLDGAVGGRSANAPAIKAILCAINIPLQLGGGIRDRTAIEMWLGAGVARIILGTVALREPQLVKDAARDHPGRIAVGIDARAGKVAVEGWSENSSTDALNLARRFEDRGVAAIIFTDISRDGMMAGPNVESTAQLARGVNIPVIASGGVRSVADIEALSKEKKIAGAVIGRALYDAKIDVKSALLAAKEVKLR